LQPNEYAEPNESFGSPISPVQLPPPYENGTPLLVPPEVTTVTLTVPLPAGATATIRVPESVPIHDMILADNTLNLTASLGPCAPPKLVPVIVTETPCPPDVGLMLVIVGGNGLK